MRRTLRSSADEPRCCPLCGRDGRILREFGRRGGEVLHLSRCARCSSEYLDPQPSNEWLAEEYGGYYSRRSGSSGSPKREFFEGLLDSLACDFSGRRVIDVGAAEGELLSVLQARWPDVQALALESHPDARPFLASLGCRYENVDVVDWLAQRPRERFDFIFLLDVLEHLRDPLPVVRDLAQHHLRPSGRIVASFPVASSASRRVLGRLWPQYKVEHLFYFSPGAVSRFEEVGQLRRTALRPLHKNLSLAYFLAVGAAFGPSLTRAACRIAGRLLPPALARLRLPLGIGESLWIAVRDDDPAIDPAEPDANPSSSDDASAEAE